MKPRVLFASSSVESLSREIGPDLSTVFPQPTASARWVFLGPHLPLRKDIKRVGSHSCRTASPPLTLMAMWQSTNAAGCAQMCGWIATQGRYQNYSSLRCCHTSDIFRACISCYAFTYAFPRLSTQGSRVHRGGQSQNVLQKVLELPPLVTFHVPCWIVSQTDTSRENTDLHFFCEIQGILYPIEQQTNVGWKGPQRVI